VKLWMDYSVNFWGISLNFLDVPPKIF